MTGCSCPRWPGWAPAGRITPPDTVSLDTVVGPLTPFAGSGPAEEGILVWDHVKRRVEDYLEEFGRPDQVAAWREGKPYVASLADTSAGR
jgi:hypothetical protein